MFGKRSQMFYFNFGIRASLDVILKKINKNNNLKYNKSKILFIPKYKFRNISQFSFFVFNSHVSFFLPLISYVYIIIYLNTYFYSYIFGNEKKTSVVTQP